jgi:hypothetical protein
MGYVEVYSDEILEATSLGKIAADFDISKGDYIKIQVLDSNDSVTDTLYSNKLLMKYEETGAYYVGEYHYNPEDGFMVGSDHIAGTHPKLIPIPVIFDDISNPLDLNLDYKKQFNIYYDDENQIYIKPPEIIKQITADAGTFKFRIYFLRDLKSPLGQFLVSQQNNLIENGNFFAGLEATQTGDLDRSFGHNRFTMKQNPGVGRFVLEQNGAGNNSYNMIVTGAEPSSNYIFSSWVAYDANYEGDDSDSFVSWSTTPILPEGEDIPDSGLPDFFISLELKGKYYATTTGGWPQCKITINGYSLVDFVVDTDEWTQYTFQVPNIPGLVSDTEIVISVTFDNDASGGTTATDRNLYWRKLTGTTGNDNRIFNISDQGNEYLTQDGLPVDNTSVLLYNLQGNLRDHYTFPGEFRQNIDWNATVKAKISAGDLFNFINPESPNINTTEGLVTSTGELDDIVTISTKTVGGIVWHKKYRLVTTTGGTNLDSINIHIGKTVNPTLSTSTLGRRYYTDLRFEKLTDFTPNTLNSYLNNLTLESDGQSSSTPAGGTTGGGTTGGGY